LKNAFLPKLQIGVNRIQSFQPAWTPHYLWYTTAIAFSSF